MLYLMKKFTRDLYSMQWNMKMPRQDLSKKEDKKTYQKKAFRDDHFDRTRYPDRILRNAASLSSDRDLRACKRQFQSQGSDQYRKREIVNAEENANGIADMDVIRAPGAGSRNAGS